MKFTTADIGKIGIIAGLYAMLTVIFAPISYSMFQFRISETLKGLAIFDRKYSLAIGLGIFVGNLFSPFGLMELTAMPLLGVVNGLISYEIGKKNLLLGAVCYALLTALSVGIMLAIYLPISVLPLIGCVAIPEIILIITGTKIAAKVLQ